jgi:hypothetical protein
VVAAAEEALFIGESTETSTVCKKCPRLKQFFDVSTRMYVNKVQGVNAFNTKTDLILYRLRRCCC